VLRLNIRYNRDRGRFEAEFQEFQGDLATVKAVGFKCDGPPVWCWWTLKVEVLNKLRANKPLSGLTITNEALEVYQKLAEIERKNAEVRALAAPVIEKEKKAKKERKKKELEEKNYVNIYIPEKPGQDFDYLGAEDLPFKEPLYKTFHRPADPTDICRLCGQPVYFYELPDLCIFCEKQLDTASVM
jgi:hypothetical protein